MPGSPPPPVRYLYLYRIGDGPAPLCDPYAWRSPPLDADAMQRGGQGLLGEQTSPVSAPPAASPKSPFRRVSRLCVRAVGGLVVLDIEANAFLLHMVRKHRRGLEPSGAGRTPRWLGSASACKPRIVR